MLATGIPCVASSRKRGGRFDGDVSGFRMRLGAVAVPLWHSLLIRRKQIPQLSRFRAFPLLDVVPAQLGADPIYLANARACQCRATDRHLSSLEVRISVLGEHQEKND